MKHILFALAFLAFAQTTFTQTPKPVSPEFFSQLQWRCIGPHRGGRTVGAVGVPQRPGVFYIGVNNGGVWKTEDFGRVWTPVFDEQPTGSIGDVAVAPSNPDVIYVGSGEGLQRPDLSIGNGIYKSTDAGRTWKNTGIRDGYQIGGLAIDPTDADRVFAAVLGKPYGANVERGVFRTTDGGKSWQKIFYLDENTGAIQVAIDPKNPLVVFAAMWSQRLGPWENGTFRGETSGLYKSTDGGTTWQKTGNGLPVNFERANGQTGKRESFSPTNLGRIGFCLAPSLPSRMFATVEADTLGGIYRSDDAGENWFLIADDERLWSRGSDFAEIKCDPKNPDIVYSANVATWKSTDGGHHWSPFRGAPGGDDYHRIWIHPDDPKIILLASDQGAIITVNGGKTFSSWYNQPTAQFYHVSTDNSFPYNVLGGQQESGSASVASRGGDGQINARDWRPVGAEEYGYVAADPLDQNIVYGGKLSRYDRRTGQTQNIAPEITRSGKYRFIRTAPVMFSPIDPKLLFYAGNVLFSTRNGGQTWSEISPDLSRETWEIPANVGVFQSKAKADQRRRGVIYALAPSNHDAKTIWAGTDDGLLHITRDGGKNWQNITPPMLTAWSKVSQLDASHFDPNTCYAAINSIRLDDLRPHILCTRDGGKSWQEISKSANGQTGKSANQLPENEPINAIREDPICPGLLFAGSENAVYFSIDDGETWQSLRQNMPATSIRDLVVKDDDLVVGTHGRSFWILDNITPLRQLKTLANEFSGKANLVLFAPQTAIRARWNNYTDTPIPQEEPAGQNPPDGAAIDYFLKAKTAGEIVIEIFDTAGIRVRRYSSLDRAPEITGLNAPLYWAKFPSIPSADAGMHRFYWDLRHDPLPTEVVSGFPISAIFGATEGEPSGPLVMPGAYVVKISAGGESAEKRFQVRLDPRVKTPLADLKKQHDLSLACRDRRAEIREAQAGIAAIEKHQIEISGETSTGKSLRSNLENLKKQATEIAPKLRRLDGQLANVFSALQESDMTPTAASVWAVQQATAAADELLGTWKGLKIIVLQIANHNLKAARLPEISLEMPVFAPLKNHPNTAEPGWENLFAPDLSDAVFPKDIWRLTPAGELTASADECIFSKKQYRDFILDLEFRTDAGTNSGIITHCSDLQNWIPNSLEIQIADDFSKQWSGAPPTWQCAAFFGHKAAEKRMVKRPGEWNRCTIVSKGREMWVLLNGELVNHLDMNRYVSATENPDGSPIPGWLSKPVAGLILEGSIGLQGKHAGADIWFKNLRVKGL